MVARQPFQILHDFVGDHHRSHLAGDIQPIAGRIPGDIHPASDLRFLGLVETVI